MFCKQCGRHIPEGETVCPACGFDTAGGQPVTNAGFSVEEPAVDYKTTAAPAEEPIPVATPVYDTGAVSNAGAASDAGAASNANGQSGNASSAGQTGAFDESKNAKINVGEDQPEKKLRGAAFSITGLVLGILNVIFFWFPFMPAITGIVGIIFSALGIRSTQKGMAIAALVINIIFELIAIVMVVVYVVVIIAAMTGNTSGINWSTYFRYN